MPVNSLIQKTGLEMLILKKEDIGMLVNVCNYLFLVPEVFGDYLRAKDEWAPLHSIKSIHGHSSSRGK